MKFLKQSLFVMGCVGMFPWVYAETVVIVNPKNPIMSLSIDDAARLFLLKSSDFPGSGALSAKPVNLPDGNPVREEFYLKSSQKDSAQVRSYWARLIFTGKAHPPKELGSQEEIKKFVAATAGAIGYIDRKQVDETVKVVLDVQ